MIRVFFGTDTVQVREAAFSYVHEREGEGVTVVLVDGDSYEAGVYAAAVGGASLFGDETLYIIDTPSSTAAWYEETVAYLPELAASSSEFVMIEGGLLAPEKKKFTKHAESMEEFKACPAERFNVFALSDALARKDKRSLWLVYSEARLLAIPVEEMIGIIWWQLKALRLASLTNTAAEADMKDFPYNKAKQSLKNFKFDELEQLSHSLIKLQHESR